MQKVQLIRRIVILAIVLAIICSCLGFLSYRNARIEADEIMKPLLEKEFYHYGTSFHPVMFYTENEEIDKWWGPGWWISYEHKTQMMTGPLSIRINLFGIITDTNPNNLREEIIPNYLKPKKTK